ncbi:Uncharacterised protein [Amycolatopsis camponoti]|uniref:Uncharacterized protein n=1 Tax=Amycolatopsis camponoti TaxID=2606593 RepID=A0A6I8M4W0_9PSEU|nr:Uncharacterised protein [Amycolatopsis camponoti]
MKNRKTRLLWTVLAVLLPGPWTPAIVLAYLLGRGAERNQDADCVYWAPPHRPPDPYACVSAPTPLNPYAPPR